MGLRGKGAKQPHRPSKEEPASFLHHAHNAQRHEEWQQTVSDGRRTLFDCNGCSTSQPALQQLSSKVGALTMNSTVTGADERRELSPLINACLPVLSTYLTIKSAFFLSLKHLYTLAISLILEPSIQTGFYHEEERPPLLNPT